MWEVLIAVSILLLIGSFAGIIWAFSFCTFSLKRFLLGSLLFVFVIGNIFFISYAKDKANYENIKQFEDKCTLEDPGNKFYWNVNNGTIILEKYGAKFTLRVIDFEGKFEDQVFSPVTMANCFKQNR